MATGSANAAATVTRWSPPVAGCRSSAGCYAAVCWTILLERSELSDRWASVAQFVPGTTTESRE